MPSKSSTYRTSRTRAQEDYLETLHRLSTQGRRGVGLLALATDLRVARSTAVAAVARLRRRGLVVQPPYGEIRLTPEGLRRSRTLHRAEEALVSFLTGVLGVPERTAAREACAMEHVLSPGTLRRLLRFLVRAAKDSPCSGS